MLALAGLSLYAQGTVDFANSTTQRVTTNTGGGLILGTHYTIALYYGGPGVVDENAFILLGPTASITSLSGRFSGGTRTTPATTPGGSAANFQLRAWETVFGGDFQTASGAPAQNRNGVVRQAYVGKTPIFQNPTGNPNADPPTTPAALLNGPWTVSIVPEPSAIAFGILGLAGLFLLRRRK